MTRKPKSKRKTIKKFKNPDVIGTREDAAAFQSVRFSLAFAAGLNEGENAGQVDDDKIDHLIYALDIITGRNAFPPTHGQSIIDYRQEIFTPEVKKSMADFAKTLRKSLIEVANEYGIDSREGRLE